MEAPSAQILVNGPANAFGTSGIIEETVLCYLGNSIDVALGLFSQTIIEETYILVKCSTKAKHYSCVASDGLRDSEHLHF